MESLATRFPKAKLWARAAELQELLEYWSGQTLIKIDETEDMGLGNITRKLRDRHQALEHVRELVTDARVELFNLP